MKKLIMMLTMMALILSSCMGPQNDPEQKDDSTKNTEVQVSAPRRTASQSNPGYDIPNEDGNYQVWYFIRIDGNIQDEFNPGMKSEDYFPRTINKKTMIDALNMGYVRTDVNWKYNAKFSKYVYSTDGKAVQDIIVSEPTIENLVLASKYKDDAAIFAPYVENAAELHCLWYACKKQDADKCWHVDGILTKKSVTDISETSYGEDIISKYGKSGEVEVDIHLQKHSDWNEIKTSVHLRDTVGVDILLPIDYQLMTDDFDIRYGKDYKYVTELPTSVIEINGIKYSITTLITHKEDGIHINIIPNKEALYAAFEYCGDGITYEIHSYVTGIPTHEYIWNQLKNSTVTTTPHTSIYGQKHSAYCEEEIIKF